MIIYQDYLMVLKYEPKSDILTVKWPDLVDVPSAVIRHSFTNLVENINNYHIAKLLLDSKGAVSNSKDEEYLPLAMDLARGLSTTRLKKFARIKSEDRKREIRNNNITQEAQSSNLLSYEYQEFDEKETALSWLIS